MGKAANLSRWGRVGVCEGSAETHEGPWMTFGGEKKLNKWMALQIVKEKERKKKLFLFMYIFSIFPECMCGSLWFTFLESPKNAPSVPEKTF